jgi:hypothetical protein
MFKKFIKVIKTIGKVFVEIATVIEGVALLFSLFVPKKAAGAA